MFRPRRCGELDGHTWLPAGFCRYTCPRLLESGFLAGIPCLMGGSRLPFLGTRSSRRYSRRWSKTTPTHTPESAYPVKLDLYRVFWWDGTAMGRSYGGPLYVPRANQRSGHSGSRHNLPDLDGVLYCSLRPASAVAEMLKPFAGQSISDRDFRQGHKLLHRAIVCLEYIGPELPDLSSPSVLSAHGWSVSDVSSRIRETSQAIARGLFAEGVNGFIWPSVLNPDWRNATLFASRVPEEIIPKGAPARLLFDHPDVQEACRYLGIRAERPGRG